MLPICIKRDEIQRDVFVLCVPDDRYTCLKEVNNNSKQARSERDSALEENQPWVRSTFAYDAT